jgi:hypothetical protein
MTRHERAVQELYNAPGRPSRSLQWAAREALEAGRQGYADPLKFINDAKQLGQG